MIKKINYYFELQTFGESGECGMARPDLQPRDTTHMIGYA